jgi:two-component system nitrogen regulation response regulator GlnG
MAPAQVVERSDLPPELRESGPTGSAVFWQAALAEEADRLLLARADGIFDALTRTLERTLIGRALAATGGRRIEASLLLGIGRNTLTRKIQELSLDDAAGGAGS